jgi:hypothetical protein
MAEVYGEAMSTVVDIAGGGAIRVCIPAVDSMGDLP